MNGLEQLSAKLKSLEHLDTQKALETLLHFAQQNAPVVTGFLRNSGHVDQDAVVFDAPYALFVEFGTSKMAAHSFLRRAADEHSREIAKAAADSADEQIRSA